LNDAETHLLRFGVRDYEPVTGRWTATDPILFEGGDSNLYAYCGADSLQCVDPSGTVARGTKHSSYAVDVSNGSAHVDLWFPPPPPPLSPFDRPYGETGYCVLRAPDPPPLQYLPRRRSLADAIDSYNDAWSNFGDALEALDRANRARRRR
jgi:RHS repeat-associated protein